MIGFLLGDGLNWLYNSAGFIGGAIVGLFMRRSLLLVCTIALSTNLKLSCLRISQRWRYVYLPIAAMSNVSQGAAALAVGFMSKDKKMKGITDSFWCDRFAWYY